MTKQAEINLDYVEAMVAILARYLLTPAEQDMEVSFDMIMGTEIFGALDEFNEVNTREIARIIRKQVHVERRRDITPREIVEYANSLPQRLREKTFSSFVVFVCNLNGEQIGMEFYDTFRDVAELLNISNALADEVIRVAKILARKII